MTLRARTPVPINSKASGANAVKEKAPPDSGSAEALLLAVAVALEVALAVALDEALAEALAVDVTLQLLGCGSSLRTSSHGAVRELGPNPAYSWVE
jgi:hypothetical protein